MFIVHSHTKTLHFVVNLFVFFLRTYKNALFNTLDFIFFLSFSHSHSVTVSSLSHSTCKTKTHHPSPEKREAFFFFSQQTPFYNNSLLLFFFTISQKLPPLLVHYFIIKHSISWLNCVMQGQRSKMRRKRAKTTKRRNERRQSRGSTVVLVLRYHWHCDKATSRCYFEPRPKEQRQKAATLRRWVVEL